MRVRIIVEQTYTDTETGQSFKASKTTVLPSLEGWRRRLLKIAIRLLS